ncbi:adenosine deaminase domain-containing protein 1 isoform X2 [Betta splendens]|uniref:Adenosine deaminase domain-containing protein 1 isoform X2 n=1 Tax=Betta splendens TaxID=158456 RepID=A0A6P7NUX1_BETSP|nr:adenosine deaminase domain-containing protein 1 isoform X2 [Betta splendens]
MVSKRFHRGPLSLVFHSLLQLLLITLTRCVQSVAAQKSQRTHLIRVISRERWKPRRDSGPRRARFETHATAKTLETSCLRMISNGSFRVSRATNSAQSLRKDAPVTSEVSEERAKSKFKPGFNVKPNVSAQTLIERYKQGATHAVTLLYQLNQILPFNLELKETVTSDNIPGSYFAFCAVIDGVKYKTGMGITKKEARLKAAELALQDFLPSLESLKCSLPELSGVPPPLPVKEEVPTSDTRPFRAFCDGKNSVNQQLIHAVRDKLTKLMSSQEFSACSGTTAAFIMQTSSGFEVVALGTGDCNTKESASSSGRLVHDSHAVVTARRSLMRFLYRHLLMFYSKTTNLTKKSIFHQNSNSNLLALKSDIILHLYVNQLPKGAARMPSMLRLSPFSMHAWEVRNDMGLHLSMEGKIISVFSSRIDDSASKLISMSTTDKITQWQVLGYQGALLSHFIEPVYVQSILIGDSSCSQTRGMEIAIIQRVEDITPQLPMFFCMIRPRISLVPSVAPDIIGSSPWTCSINWSEGDCSLEVVDSLEGRTIEDSPFKSGPALASRLCKAAMLHRFRLVAKEAQRQDLLSTSSYREAKNMAKPYQEGKKKLRTYLSQCGFGSWLAKPAVSDNFSM